MSSSISDPRPYEQYLLTLALLLITALLVYTQAAKRLDLLSYDAAINTFPAPVDPDTVIVSIDEKSLNGIGQWPWRRAIHAQLIDKLTQYNAALVSFDIIFSERDSGFPEDDQLLARAIKNNGNVLLPLHIHPLSYGDTLSEILPIPDLVKAAKGLGHIHVDLDEDGLARGLYLNSGMGDAYWPALSMAMAAEINPMIKYLKQVEEQHAAPFVSVNTQYRLIPFAGPGGTFPTYSYLDVLLDQVPAEVFRDKTVLVGATAAGLGDVIPTPVSQLNTPMSGVELHANAYSSLMTQSAIKPIAPLWTYLLTFAFILIPILVFPRLKPTYVMPSTAILVLLVLGFSYGLLVYDHSWFPPINSVLGVLIAYPLWSWQRMRHLNSFLSNELERLTKEPAIGFRKLRQHPVEKVFLSLLPLLKPKHYLLIKNHHPLHSFEKEGLTKIKVRERGKWMHGEHASWIKLSQGGDTYKLGLGWSNSENREQIKDFLNKLDLSIQPKYKQRRYYERIANRTAQVREAISSMQDMRTFISKGFEEMPDAVLVTDPIGVVVFCNGHTLKWLNKKGPELIGRPIHEIFETEQEQRDKIINNTASVLITGKQENFETHLSDRDIMVHCVPFLVDLQSDAGLMMTMSDITRIRQQQREKNQLIDFLSHDVRSPLVSQLAMLQGLRTGRIEWSENLIDDIEQHAQRSLNLSDQFLQITRAEQSAETEFYEFDLINTVENSIDTQTQLAKSKHIDILFEQDEEPVWLKGNAELIERAITNLLSNAIKYSDPNTQVTFKIEQNDDSARLHVIDQGYGIETQELPYIFKRFRRQRNSEVSGEKGAGLGLNFVKVVVEKHNGQISVNSEPGQGTTFSLEFPKATIQ